MFIRCSIVVLAFTCLGSQAAKIGDACKDIGFPCGDSLYYMCSHELKCVCRDDAKLNMHGECASLLVMDQCEAKGPTKCSMYDHSYCDEEGYCTCEAHYHMNKESTRCTNDSKDIYPGIGCKYGGVEGACPFGAHCRSRWVSGQKRNGCFCDDFAKVDPLRHRKRCTSVLGDECARSMVFEKCFNIPNALCRADHGLSTTPVCSCVAGYKPNQDHTGCVVEKTANDRFVSKSRPDAYPGDPCSYDGDVCNLQKQLFCMAHPKTNVTTCDCRLGYKAVDGVCLSEELYSQCDPSVPNPCQLQSNTECVNGICRCSVNFSPKLNQTKNRWNETSWDYFCVSGTGNVHEHYKTCDNDHVCGDDKSCDQGICLCPKGTVILYENDKCEGVLGKMCDISGVIENCALISGAECRRPLGLITPVCSCKEGNKPDANWSHCVPGVHNGTKIQGMRLADLEKVKAKGTYLSPAILSQMAQMRGAETKTGMSTTTIAIIVTAIVVALAIIGVVAWLIVRNRRKNKKKGTLGSNITGKSRRGKKSDNSDVSAETGESDVDDDDSGETDEGRKSKVSKVSKGKSVNKKR